MRTYLGFLSFVWTHLESYQAQQDLKPELFVVLFLIQFCLLDNLWCQGDWNFVELALFMLLLYLSKDSRILVWQSKQYLPSYDVLLQIFLMHFMQITVLSVMSRTQKHLLFQWIWNSALILRCFYFCGCKVSIYLWFFLNIVPLCVCHEHVTAIDPFSSLRPNFFLCIHYWSRHST